jgi:cell division septation protein DedD
MGTPFRKKSTKLTLCMLFIYVLLFGATAEASVREVQLFDQAYYSYLSYRPEKAVEEFRTFLDEFPNSSAKDAALFWLAKSLLQVKSIHEAKKTFAYIKEQFPESPFICYVAKELETIGNASGENSSVKVTVDTDAGQETVRSEIPQVPATSTNQKAINIGDIQNTGYALQVGSFKTRESAETLRRSLQKKISPEKITICQQGDFFKVRITGFDIKEINAMLNAGIDGLVIKTGEKACGIWEVSP